MEYNVLIILCNLFCVIFCSIFMGICLKKILSGKLNVLYIVYMGFFIFYVLPIFLDIIIGKPDYSYYTNFNGFIGLKFATNDVTTNIMYTVILVISTIFLFAFSGGREVTVDNFVENSKSLSLSLVYPVLNILILLPLVISIITLVSTSQSLMKLLSYEDLRLLFRVNASDDFLFYYYLALIAIICFALRSILFNKKIIPDFLIFGLPLFVAFGIHGKRNIIAIFAFLMLFSIILRGRVKAKNIKYLLIGTACIILITSVFYQMSIRGIGTDGDFLRSYTDFRVDFGRDHVVKLALYNKIHDIRLIFDNSNTLLYIPKKILSLFLNIDTGQKYSVYATASAIGDLSGFNLGWGLTTGIYDESISNFGIIGGVIFANVVLRLVFYIGDSSENMLVTLLSYAVGFLLLILQLVSFVYIFIPWMITVVLNLVMKRRRNRSALKVQI